MRKPDYGKSPSEISEGLFVPLNWHATSPAVWVCGMARYAHCHMTGRRQMNWLGGTVLLTVLFFSAPSWHWFLGSIYFWLSAPLLAHAGLTSEAAGAEQEA